MNYNNKLIYYFSLSIIVVALYRSSWFPFQLTVGTYIYHYIFLVLGLILLVVFDENKVLKLKHYIFKYDYYFLNLLIVFLFISFFLYNFADFTKIIGIVKIFTYLTTFCLFFIFLPKFLINNPVYFTKYLKFVIFIGSFTAVLGLVILFTGTSPIEKYKTYLISFITHPNNVSIIFTYTIITTLFYYYAVQHEIKLYGKIILLSSVIVQLVAQFFSFTRAGMIASTLSVLMFLFVIYRKKMIFVVPIFAVSLSSLFVSFFVAKGFNSFFSRFLLLIPAYYMITNSIQSLLWGNGLVSIKEKYQYYMLQYGVLEKDIEDPHNSLVYFIMIFGLLVTLTILFFIIKNLTSGTFKLLKLLRNENKYRYEILYIAYLISLIFSLMVHGLFDSELVKSEFYSIQIFFTSIGLLYNYNKYRVFGKIKS